MIIKDLVVTGIVKLLRHANIDTLVAEKINSVTKEEIDALKGVKSNIQNQLSVIDKSITDAIIEQTNFKSNIADAINNIPRNPNTRPLTSSSGLSQFVSGLGEIEHGPDVSDVTATADKVLSGYKFVNGKWQVVTGTMPKRERFIHSMNSPENSFGYWNGTHSIDGDSEYYWMWMPTGYYENHLGHDGWNEVHVPRDLMNNKIGLTASKLKYGERVAGVDGIYTNDGTIVSNDMISGTVGYSKGQRVVGNLPEYGTSYVTEYTDHRSYDVGQAPAASVATSNEYKRLYIRIPRGVYRRPVRDGDMDCFEIFVPFADLVAVLGIDAGTMLNNKTIAGVTGTIPNYGYEPLGSVLGTYENRLYMYVPNYNTINGQEQCYLVRAMYRPLADLGNASANDVLSGKTFTSTAGLKVTGTMENRDAYTPCLSVGNDGSTFYVRIPNGAYLNNSTGSGQTEITVSHSKIAELIGLTGDKIVKGNTILGVAGTASPASNPIKQYSDSFEPDYTEYPDSYADIYEYYNDSNDYNIMNLSQSATITKVEFEMTGYCTTEWNYASTGPYAGMYTPTVINRGPSGVCTVTGDGKSKWCSGSLNGVNFNFRHIDGVVKVYVSPATGDDLSVDGVSHVYVTVYYTE